MYRLRDIKVGYAPIKQPYFDQKWANGMYQRSLALLRGLHGVELIESSGTITTEEDAQKAAKVQLHLHESANEKITTVYML